MPSTPLSPNPPYTHTNSHKETHTGCLCYLCEDIEKCQGNSLSSGVHKNTLTRLQFTDTLTVNTIRTHNTLYCFTFDTKVFPITCNLFLSALNLTIQCLNLHSKTIKNTVISNRIALVKTITSEKWCKIFSITMNIMPAQCTCTVALIRL